jgi:hypothetical protein
MRSGYDIKSQVQSQMFLKQEFEEYNGNDTITKLLSKPNEGQAFVEFVQFVLINKMIFGGCPVYSNPGEIDTGKTLGLYAYNPDMLQIRATPNLMGIKEARINYFGNIKEINPANLYFVKYEL